MVLPGPGQWLSRVRGRRRSCRVTARSARRPRCSPACRRTRTARRSRRCSIRNPTRSGERHLRRSSTAAAAVDARRPRSMARLDREQRSVKRALFAAARDADSALFPRPVARLSPAALCRFARRAAPTSDPRCALARDRSRAPGRAGLWLHLLARLPAPYDSAPLFLFGWATWRDGNGTLAAMAAERALDQPAGLHRGRAAAQRGADRARSASGRRGCGCRPARRVGGADDRRGSERERVRRDRRRQFGGAAEGGVDRGGAGPSFGDRPDDQAGAAGGVAAGVHPGAARLPAVVDHAPCREPGARRRRARRAVAARRCRRSRPPAGPARPAARRSNPRPGGTRAGRPTRTISTSWVSTPQTRAARRRRRTRRPRATRLRALLRRGRGSCLGCSAPTARPG